MKPKLLCILHRSPPAHGAAKVGDFIAESKILKEMFDCRFIAIRSSDTIESIGKVNFKKIYLVIELYLKVLVTLFTFRPNKVYFTASVSGVAFYRDMLLSALWKMYRKVRDVDIYYHFHTKGVDRFVSGSQGRVKLTNVFVKDAYLIILSSLLKNDFEKISTFKEILYLPNGVENPYDEDGFEEHIQKKNFEFVNVLYLSNMIKTKGYFEVLKLANRNKGKDYHFHFAGGWQNQGDEDEFFKYIDDNDLGGMVTFHGFVIGEQKNYLFERCQLFVFPTRYENEAFPLSILEAFSYGLPVVSTDEGAILSIIDDSSGIVINDLNKLAEAFDEAVARFINIDTARYCRKRYLENFSLEQFEENLVRIFE